MTNGNTLMTLTAVKSADSRKLGALAARLTALMLAVVLMIPSLSGCGKSQESKKTEAVSLHTLTILGDSARSEVYSELLKSFTKEHPEVYLRDITAQPSDAFKLNVTLESTYRTTDAPHIVYYYTDTGISELYDEYITVNEIRRVYPEFASGVSEQALTAANGGKTTMYCIPAMGQWSAVVVNTELLNKAGAQIPQDWYGLLDTISLLSGSDIIPFANPADDSAVIIELIAAAYGGQTAVELGTDRSADVLGSVWLPAIERYEELCRAGAFPPAAVTDTIEMYACRNDAVVSGSDAAVSVQISNTDVQSNVLTSDSDIIQAYADILGERDITRRLDAVELFNEGKAAMIAIDSTQLPELTVNSLQVMAFPAPPDATVVTGGITVSFREGFYITRNAFDNPETRELVISFVDHLVSSQASDSYAALGYYPANSSVQQAGDTLSQVMALAGATESWISTTRVDANAPFWTQVEKYCAQMQYGVISPAQTIELLADSSLETQDLLGSLEPEPQEPVQPDVSPTDAQYPTGAQ